MLQTYIMRAPFPLRILILACGLAAALPAQRMNKPLGPTPSARKPPAAKAQDQNTQKPDEPIDPTKDPMKDPSKDITVDPSKDPKNGVPAADANAADQTDNRGADQTAGTAEAPDYTGPSILSRGFVLSRPAIAANEKFQAYVGVNAVYDSGFRGAYAQGAAVPSTNSVGLDLNYGISGRHYRRKDLIDLTYSGHYYDYKSSSTYGGQDHSLSVGYMRELSPHYSFSLREVGGLYSNNYSLLNSVAIADTSVNSSTLVVSPNTEAFDDRTLFSTTQATFIWQKTARLSFSSSASAFFVKRDSLFLANSKGTQFSGDTAYRISKRQTIGVYYTHSDYSYTKVLSSTTADSVGGSYSLSLSRSTDISTRFGITHLETQGLQQVALNPYLQSILGISTGIEKFDTKTYAPDVTITVNRRIQKSSLGFSFVAGITPGNGLILTSRRQSVSASWEYHGFRKYSFQVAAGRDQLSGYINTVSGYSSYFGRVSAYHPMGRNLTSVATFDYRQQAVDSSGFHQKEWRISLGFRYNPSDLLRF